MIIVYLKCKWLINIIFRPGGHTMPLVKIEILKGHSKDYKTMLLQSVHDGLVNALSIPDDDRNQRLYVE